MYDRPHIYHAQPTSYDHMFIYCNTALIRYTFQYIIHFNAHYIIICVLPRKYRVNCDICMMGLGYVTSKQPVLIILENVPGLLGVNLEACMTMLQNAGYIMRCYMLNSIDTFTPQSRRRIWMCGISKRHADAAGWSVSDVQNRLDRYVELFMSSNPRAHLCDFLLPENHPSVVKVLNTASTHTAGSVSVHRKWVDAGFPISHWNRHTENQK